MLGITVLFVLLSFQRIWSRFRGFAYKNSVQVTYFTTEEKGALNHHLYRF